MEKLKPETAWENLILTTIRLEVKHQNIINKGTSFCYHYNHSQLGDTIALVTNRHMIEHGKEFTLTFLIEKEKEILLGEKYELTLPLAEWWTFHPDQKIDIAVMPMLGINKILRKNKIEIALKTYGSDGILDNDDLIKELDAVEDVHFIGYPNDIYDKKNNLPIVRKATTSTPVYVDYNNLPAFLIGGSVFPGSSGSPVFFLSSMSPKRGKNILSSSRFFFLGILSKGFLIHGAELLAKNIINTSLKERIDLGLVFKARTIEETIEYAIEKAVKKNKQ